MGNGRVAIPQEMGGLPEMVVFARHSRADPQPVALWSGGSEAVSKAWRSGPCLTFPSFFSPEFRT
jgi:hypothetical protein